jgi:nitrate reductase gamma subunit
VGYSLSWLFSNPAALPAVYGFVWYLHAVLTGAFVAYLPFSRLLHIIIAPVVLTANARGGNIHGMKNLR